LYCLYVGSCYTAENFPGGYHGRNGSHQFLGVRDGALPLSFDIFQNPVRERAINSYKRRSPDHVCSDMEAASNAIREIIQHKVECKEGEFLYFFPFMTSICIENGIVKYSLPREIENFMLHFPQFNK